MLGIYGFIRDMALDHHLTHESNDQIYDGLWWMQSNHDESIWCQRRLDYLYGWSTLYAEHFFSVFWSAMPACTHEMIMPRVYRRDSRCMPWFGHDLLPLNMD